jgi:flagellar motility protein MotE (MotC chaperone)
MVRPLSTEEFAAVVAQMDQGQRAELMERMEEIEARTRDDDPPSAA